MDQFNIFLIGFMGTGKTTIANCLSRKLDRKVVEMDQIISERAGMSISDIFKTYGEQHFRDLETGLLVETRALFLATKSSSSAISCCWRL